MEVEVEMARQLVAMELKAKGMHLLQNIEF